MQKVCEHKNIARIEKNFLCIKTGLEIETMSNIIESATF